MNLVCALICAALAAQLELEPRVVKLERRGGEELWTVRAKECSLGALLARIGELSGLTLDAGSRLAEAPRVTISLTRRPLEQVLEFALGSAGFLFAIETPALDRSGDGILHVRADRSSAETSDERAGLAAAAWARAAARFPRHPVAATARLAQGELAELRGEREHARERYLDLMAAAPGSSATPEAYLRAGRIAAERGDWSEASEHFRALANLPRADEYQALARIELASATLHLGDAEGALHILSALDESHPCWERTEVTARVLVRVEALLARARFQDALLELEAQAGALDPLGARALPRLRARALEGAGLADEASRAWLLVAREERGPERGATYQTAARLAEEANDPVGVLYVAREAEAAGFQGRVAAAEARARTALGMKDGGREPSARTEQRLAEGEGLLETGELVAAQVTLEPLFTERDALALPDVLRARVALAWGRCVAAAESWTAATAILRAERARVTSVEARALLDRGTARLLEELGLYERASDAYQGDY